MPAQPQSHRGKAQSRVETPSPSYLARPSLLFVAGCGVAVGGAMIRPGESPSTFRCCASPATTGCNVQDRFVDRPSAGAQTRAFAGEISRADVLTRERNSAVQNDACTSLTQNAPRVLIRIPASLDGGGGKDVHGHGAYRNCAAGFDAGSPGARGAAIAKGLPQGAPGGTALGSKLSRVRPYGRSAAARFAMAGEVSA